ncbi:MAG TPA: alpha/beta fold hydrolase [Nitrospiraceae bacterium]|nr:alpha/beta fold hydrolase [Nitrospiraceae bacterium]
MKRSSSWNSRIHPRRPGCAFEKPHIALVVFILLCHIMTACSSPPSIPAQLDAIERIPVKTVQVHDQRIAYLDVGTGAPVILIHGFGGSMWQWEHQQHALAQHFRVLTLDLPGSGLSDKPEIDYRPDQMLDFFVGFMDAVKLTEATLVGNSMGAGLAIGMALTHPARVTKLVLIGGLPQHVLEKLTSPSIRRALETGAPSWLVSLGNWLFGGLMIESVLKEIVHDPSLLTPAVIERSNRNRQRPGLIKPIMTVRENLPLWESGFATRIGAITHPTLVIWGAEDRVFPVAVGEELHRTIKGSRFIPIPAAGHIPQWEQPGMVNQSLIAFIQS